MRFRVTPTPKTPQHAEGDLRRALQGFDPAARRWLLDGLLLPDRILVGAYTAPQHRLCPLSGAVWQASGHEPASRDEVVAAWQRMGLGTDSLRFAGVFDAWARYAGYAEFGADGIETLSEAGRSRLVWIVESEMTQPSAR